MTIIDQTCDPGLATMRVLMEKNPNLFEFTKTASMGAHEFEELPNAAYAWPDARRYPIHTPEHTALSMAYIKEAGVRIPGDVIANLARAAAIHGIAPNVVQSQEKTASDDTSEFLLPEKRRFRVKTAEDVALAEHIFFEKFAQMSVEDRAIMAQNLVKSAEQHGVDLHPSTHKLACLTMTSTQIFRDWMRAREEAATKLGAVIQAQAYQKLGDAFKNAEPLLDRRGDQVKLASCVLELDKQAGLVPMYDHSILDPLRTVFNTDVRRDQFVKIGSVLQNKDLIRSMPLTFWQDALGDDIAQEIAPGGVVDPEALEQILPTLPADMKSAVETQLAAYNTQ